jgi:hypothetical protein
LTDDHTRELELLAGYVMLGLDGPDAEEADRLLSEHLPRCSTCRDALDEMRETTGDLALAAAPAVVPDLVLARIRRGIQDVPIRRRRATGMIALVASVAALVGMAGFSFSLGTRARDAEAQRGTALEVLNAVGQQGAVPVSLEPATGSGGGLVEVSAPDLERMYLYGSEVPAPAPGSAYQLWLGADGSYTPVGPQFVPESGLVLLEITVDPARYDEILITEELLGSTPPGPTPEGGHTWGASI